MDITEIMHAIIKGGDGAVFLVFAAVAWWLHHGIKRLTDDLDRLTSEFKDFQIIHANERVRREDLDELKELMREHNAATNSILDRLMERVDAQATRCGHDCIAGFGLQRELKRTGKM
ncbi:MAG: hypothetical protein HQL84_16115 [Magnetococcales bacterium]|nr:hypothetical protein [Magnetococcales bacterium]MBF0151546.1 hypothetical protein [Magnetococcales bacterium]